MKTKMRRALGGSFVGRGLAAGVWRLSAGAWDGPDGDAAEIYLIGAEPDAAQTLRGGSFAAATLEWVETAPRSDALRDGVRPEDAVRLTLTSTAGTHVLWTRNAIIHEPLTQLYDGLPLASFDASARRFWRRVFRLVRVPGGRHLIGLIAHRARR